MSIDVLKKAIAEQKMKCPACGKAVKQFDKYVPMLESAYDGPGSSLEDADSGQSKVTLICGNAGCDWKERTEYWRNYIE